MGIAVTADQRWEMSPLPRRRRASAVRHTARRRRGLAAEAARVLVDGEHDTLVRAEVATWPAEAPDPADDVRALLDLAR